ncbi:MAG TPA: hypothetical protein IGS37_06130 [Synechococcales cyanobacterium M55_K2018_004]|nr:hypothetical protein [Synechococcales cyanobacterium M55_K2018_004]
MEYSFELIGVSPILSFFNHQLYQQTDLQTDSDRGAEYLAAYRCTLDAFIDSMRTAVPRRGWNFDQAVDTVIDFWFRNEEQIRHWKRRLEDAGSENLLVGRLADVRALRIEFDALLKRDRPS